MDWKMQLFLWYIFISACFNIFYYGVSLGLNEYPRIVHNKPWSDLISMLVAIFVLITVSYLRFR